MNKNSKIDGYFFYQKYFNFIKLHISDYCHKKDTRTYLNNKYCAKN